MTRRSGLSALKFIKVALLATPLMFVTTGCNPECVDKYDCKTLEALPENVTAKKKFTCEANKCVECAKTGCPGTGGTGGGMSGTGGGMSGTGGGAAGGAGGGVAAPTAFIAKMTANQEVPPTTSTAVGNVNVVVSAEGDGGFLATMTGALTGFVLPDAGVDPSMAVHIHHKHAGVSGGFLGGAAGSFVATNGVAGAVTLTGSTPYAPAEVAEIVAGRTYVNVHSATFTGGAVRGQLLLPGQLLWSAQLSGAAELPLPSPYSAGLAGVGFIVSLDGSIAYEGSWTADVAATASHIHLGDATTSGPVVIGLTVVGNGVAGSLSTQQADAGTDQYVNVHTADAGDGLIRGQIVKH